MTTQLMTHFHRVVVIEQVNPLSPPAEAKYKYVLGNTEPNEFFLSYPRGNVRRGMERCRTH